MTSPPRRLDVAGLVIAGLVLALAGLVYWDMSTLQLNAVYGVGPKAMPMVVAAGLALLAIANAVSSIRGGLPKRETVDFRAIAYILGGVVALIVLIAVGGGFILATAFLFAAVARAFGRKALLADLVIGLVLGLCAYLLFAKLLALTLPAGPIERLI